MKKLNLVISAFIALALMYSCEEGISTADITKSVPVVSENTNMELSALQVFEDINVLGFTPSSLKSDSLSEEVPKVEWSDNTLTLDYSDVLVASGKVIVVFQESPSYSEGVVANVSFDNFQRRGTSISGELKLTVKAFSDNSLIQFQFETVGDADVEMMGESFKWSCMQTYDWIEGFITPTDYSDDVFLVNGTATQIVSDTVSNHISLQDVVYATNCDLFKEGVLSLSTNDTDVETDFSVGKEDGDSGMCDSWVKLTIGGFSMNINIAAY